MAPKLWPLDPASVNNNYNKRHPAEPPLPGTFIWATWTAAGSDYLQRLDAISPVDADELDDSSGVVLRYLCSRCARVARGEPVCRVCGEQIIDTDAGWRHVNDQRRHPATPLIAV
jgi:hypothetical protein